MGSAHRLRDPVERRLLKGETIPQEKKIVSVFEPHTRWIAKGKAGTPVELGVPVCVIEDPYQFILGHQILWEGGDRDGIVPCVHALQAQSPRLQALSLDKGFWSPAIYEALSSTRDVVALPKKGRPTAVEREGSGSRLADS